MKYLNLLRMAVLLVGISLLSLGCKNGVHNTKRETSPQKVMAEAEVFRMAEMSLNLLCSKTDAVIEDEPAPHKAIAKLKTEYGKLGEVIPIAVRYSNRSWDCIYNSSTGELRKASGDSSRPAVSVLIGLAPGSDDWLIQTRLKSNRLDFLAHKKGNGMVIKRVLEFWHID